MNILTSASSELHLEALEVSVGLDALDERHSLQIGYDLDRNMKEWRPRCGPKLPLESDGWMGWMQKLSLNRFIRSVSYIFHRLNAPCVQDRLFE